MKKSTLLSFATAAAILATSAGTYAAWDQLDATSTGQSVTLRTPATVNIGTDLAVFTNTDTFEAAPSSTSTATFTLKDMPADTTGYEFKATVEVMDGSKNVTDKVNATATPDSTAVADGNKVVTVNIAPADNTDAKALAGKTLTVTVKGEVVKKTGV